MEDRQKRWLEKGYTKEQIENHLHFERRKSKESRERRKKSNEKNKEIIAKVKSDLLGKTFETGYAKNTILSIRPSTDGIGFWFKTLKQFKDGSEGEFRYFSWFADYSLKSFLEEINH